MPRNSLIEFINKADVHHSQILDQISNFHCVKWIMIIRLRKLPISFWFDAFFETVYQIYNSEGSSTPSPYRDWL